LDEAAIAEKLPASNRIKVIILLILARGFFVL